LLGLAELPIGTALSLNANKYSMLTQIFTERKGKGSIMFDSQPSDFARSLVEGVTPSNVVRFTVFGEPRSKQRARVTKYGAYTPKETLLAEGNIRETWDSLGVNSFPYHVLVSIDFYNGNKRRRDIDNMAKLVLDALNKHAYGDDNQIVALELRKFFTTPERARTEITLTEVIEWPHEHQIFQKILRS
jgi:Holliday junction resolvase RusA-like endonuclease